MLSDPNVAKFLEATSENPTFAKVDLFETPGFCRDEFETPYARVDVAVLNCSRDLTDNHVYARMAVLDVEDLGPSYIYRQLEYGDYLTRDVQDMDGSVLEPNRELKDKYTGFVNMHENAPYMISSRLYGPYVVPKGQEPYMGRAEAIDGTEVTFDLEGKTLKNGQPVNSINSACQWLVENQHAYMQGAMIHQHMPGDKNKPVPSGDFLCTAVPCWCDSYPEGTFENFENRREYAKIQALNFGTDIGGPTAEEILKEQKTKVRPLPEGPKAGQKQYENQLTLD